MPTPKGTKLSEEHRRKIALARTGKKHSPETLAKLSASAKARGLRGPNLGKHLSKEHRAKLAAVNKGKKISEETRAKFTGENSSQWKGDKVGYRAVHSWIVRMFGQPDTCEGCSRSGLTGRKIHWANLSGKYLRDRSDWKRLCASCHSKLDGKVKNLTKGNGVA